MTHSIPLRACLLGIAGACALGAAQAHPSEPATTAASAAPAVQPTTTEAQALRAVRDKATGKLRAPTADEEKAMAAAERAARKARGEPEAASQPLVVTRHASGMLSAKLGPEYMMTLKGERRPDGSVRRFHPDGTTHDHAPVARDALPTE